MSPFYHQSNKKNAYNSSNQRQDYKRTDDTKQRQKTQQIQKISQNRFESLAQPSDVVEEINIEIPQQQPPVAEEINIEIPQQQPSDGQEQELNIIIPKAEGVQRPQKSFTSNIDRNQNVQHRSIVDKGTKKQKKRITLDDVNDENKNKLAKIYKLSDPRKFEHLIVSANNDLYPIYDTDTGLIVQTYSSSNPFQQFTTNPGDDNCTTTPVFRKPAVIIRRKVVEQKTNQGEEINIVNYQTFETFTIDDTKQLMLLSGRSNLQQAPIDPNTHKPLFSQVKQEDRLSPNDAFLKFDSREETVMMQHILQSFGGQQTNIKLKYYIQAENKRESVLPKELPQYSPFAIQHIKSARNTIVKYKAQFVQLCTQWSNVYGNYPQITFKIPRMYELYSRKWAFPDYNFQFSANFEGKELDSQKYIAARFPILEYNQKGNQWYQTTKIQFLRIIVTHDVQATIKKVDENNENIPVQIKVKKLLFVPCNQDIHAFFDCYQAIIGKVKIDNKTDPNNPTLEIEKDINSTLEGEATMDEIDNNYQSIYFKPTNYYKCVQDWKTIQSTNINIIKRNLGSMLYLRRYYVRYILFFEKVINNKSFKWDFFCLVDKNDEKQLKARLPDQQVQLFRISDTWFEEQLVINNSNSDTFFKPFINDLTLKLEDEKNLRRYDIQYFQDLFVQSMKSFASTVKNDQKYKSLYENLLTELKKQSTQAEKYDGNIMTTALDTTIKYGEYKIKDPYYDNVYYKVLSGNQNYDEYNIIEYYLKRAEQRYSKLSSFIKYCTNNNIAQNIENIYNPDIEWFGCDDQFKYEQIKFDANLTADQKILFHSIYNFINQRTAQLFFQNPVIANILGSDIKFSVKIEQLKNVKDYEISFLKEYLRILQIEMMFYLRRAIECQKLNSLMLSQDKSRPRTLYGYHEFNYLELEIKFVKMRLVYLNTQDQSTGIQIAPEKIFFGISTYYRRDFDSQLSNFESKHANGIYTGIALSNIKDLFTYFNINTNDCIFTDIPDKYKQPCVKNINSLMRINQRIECHIFLWTSRGLNYNKLKQGQVEPEITNNTTVADLIKLYQPNPSFIDNNRQ